jgi:nitrile hydratase accessory protein
MVMALADAGVIDWEDFRQTLIGEISHWEAAHPSGEGWSYYGCWLRSLERAVSAKGLVTAAALEDRVALLAALPAGHDHDIQNASSAVHHDHDHGDPGVGGRA